MAAMHALSERYEGSNDLQMDVRPGKGDLPQMEVGSGNQEPSPNHPCNWPRLGRRRNEALQADPAPGSCQACSLALTLRPRNLMTGRMATTIRLSGGGYRAAVALDKVNKIFLRTPSAGEAAVDGGFQMHYEKTPFDQLAFIEELFSLMVVNCLTEELGCDEIIDKVVKCG